MTARSPGAFMLSAVFHAAIISLVFLLAFMADQREKVTPHVLELVAGAGSNYGATVAPRLGTPGGVKLEMPAIREPESRPTPPAPAPEIVPEKPVPITRAPTTPPKATPAPKADSAIPNFKRQIQRKVWAADAKAKKEVARERAEEQKRLKKEEYDRLMRERAKAARNGTTPKISHIDAEGIAAGVVGGSTDNKIGGAGGRALVRSEGSVIDAYYALLRERVEDALDKPPNLSDDLATTIVFHISASGHISNVHISKSSGSDDWDRAVVAAFSRVEMPEHPEHHGEDLELTFRTNAVER